MNFLFCHIHLPFLSFVFGGIFFVPFLCIRRNEQKILYFFVKIFIFFFRPFSSAPAILAATRQDGRGKLPWLPP
jgi:ABC-type arginine/histidine transport system permease subunit